MAPSVEAIRKEVEAQSKFVARLRDRMARVIVGQQYMVDRLLVGLLANGHVLIEGVPGLAKTTAVKTLAQAMNCSFSRIQFTPDLLPADLIGTLVYSPKDGEFTTKKGPIFANIILADEINRAPAKVQSALLEAMQERQVTIGDTTYPLEEPFMVMATQNPIEQEGTYPLPEAQVDRFMLKLRVNYPSKIEEREIMDRVNLLHAPEVRPAVTREEILQAQALVNQIYVDEKAKDYIVNIVQATRHPEAFELNINHLIEYGASPRATIYLQQAARALAFLQGEGNVFPNDVKQVAMDILRHRIIVTYEAEAENMTSEDIIRQILDTVPVP
ncbi:MAG TPA: MoxR family ATPase [Candidatus Hydrogenedentes bacterium]|jgi:MoxR-like ATPase|nr:MoxR family ATPase [Candidatus Hydrogenedentota bacterium]NLT61516.1 MoxR family ATPase [Candidatus Hydrogenedentota bacterium]HNV22267.1 MoxR family ATPase [Candidatus Hydrogenedentota bacterium]HNZ18259.1 MoxR family ATPase [Candidatus Hydrogenedentota bacterium]HOH34858.1 MoxR family ATPase [Candidatus Hydrogenedentota bacterium]